MPTRPASGPTLPAIGAPAPDLAVDLVGGGSFKLADATPERFTLLAFYRGLHCPVCRDWLRDLQDQRGNLARSGVDVVAVSMDTAERATEAVDAWDLDDLDVGHGLTEEAARDWGLYLSDAVKDGEPARFSEPGLFLVQRDGALFYAAVNSMPFGRPDPEEMSKSIHWVLEQGYPSRGRAA